MKTEDYELMKKAVAMIQQCQEGNQLDELKDVLAKVKEKLNLLLKCG